MLIPKNIFKGRNSNGNSFRFVQWDGREMMNFEFLTKAVPILLVGLVLASFFGPILTIIAVVNFSLYGKPFHVISAICCYAFLYDCNGFWLMSQSIDIFFGEIGVNMFIILNVATFGFNLLIFFFGNIIYTLLTNEKFDRTEDEWRVLPNATKEIIENNVKIKLISFYIITIFVLLVIGFNYRKQHFPDGWVKVKRDYWLSKSDE